MDSNIQAFLNTIGYSEGANYNTLYGGNTFADYSTFPNVRVTLANGDTTSAAGKYQFEAATWNGLQSSLSLPDFTPQSQDAAAIQLLKDNNAYDSIVNGDIVTAINNLGNIWASFPSSTEGQPGGKTLQQLTDYYTSQGGVIGGKTNKVIDAFNATLQKYFNTTVTNQTFYVIAAETLIVIVALIFLIFKKNKK